MNKSNTIFFVTGVHGVGKSTLCNEISQLLDIQIVIASEIIKNAQYLNPSKDKKVVNIRQNQIKLLSGLQIIKEHYKKFILDGHLALITEDYISSIDFDVIKQINPTAIILITDNPKLIMHRLSRRDNLNYSIDLIQDLQLLEEKTAKDYARQLDCEFIEVNLHVSISPVKRLVNLLSKYL